MSSSVGGGNPHLSSAGSLFVSDDTGGDMRSWSIPPPFRFFLVFFFCEDDDEDEADDGFVLPKPPAKARGGSRCGGCMR